MAEPKIKEDFKLIINESGVLNTQNTEITEFIKSNIKMDNKDFFIVSIMGCQSGGKSTLLNQLFGTEFPVLEIGERRATTKGVMLSFAKDYDENVILFDLEGSDSNEKSETEGETFSRQIALFALAVSEALLINIWSHDVGKRTAMNFAILKSVFEVNLRFSISSITEKTKIIFVLRDYDEKLYGTLEKIENLVRSDIRKIWEAIEKPAKHQDTTIDQMFDFYFVGIPHKVYKNKEFVQSINELKNRFKLESKCCFFDKSHLQKTKEVPADHLYEYVSNIWKSIKACEELNIVSQKESLTSSLCEKTAEKCLEEFKEKLGLDFDRTEFKKSAEKLYNEALVSYDEKIFPNAKLPEDESISSVTKIRLKHREKLENAIFALFQIVQREESVKGMDSATKKYEESYAVKLMDVEKLLVGFDKSKKDCYEESLRVFESANQRLILNFLPEQNLVKKTEFDKRQKELEAHFNYLGTSTFKDTVLEELYKRVVKIREPFTEALETVWEIIFELRMDLNKIIDQKTDQFYSLNEDMRAKNKMKRDLYFRILERFIQDIFALSEAMDYIIIKKFNKLFRFDERGVPRNWRRCKKASEIWLDAKDKCLKILDIYTEIKEFHKDNTYPPVREEKRVLLNREKLEYIKGRFEAHIYTELKEAEMIQNYNETNIPAWIYAVILILGMNEIIFVLKNPLLLIFFVVVGSILYWAYLRSDGVSNLYIGLADTILSTARQQMRRREAAASAPSQPPRQTAEKKATATNDDVKNKNE